MLIAPLDWGLGHASRCIPLIHEFLKHPVEVIIGGTGLSGQFLKMEFPHLSYVEIPGYEVTYSSKLPMSVAMLRQAPGIMKSIQKENDWLAQFIKNEPLDMIISDHRYGLYHPEIYSVFMGHQLFISAGQIPMMEQVLWKVNKSYIEKFDFCIIPDLPGEINASGKLAHKETIPFKHEFIGLLSRINTNTIPQIKNIDVSFILSGPEPLRTELENILIEQSESLQINSAVLIRGTDKKLSIDIPSYMNVYDIATSETVNEIIGRSKIVVSRSGYSSIMDYLVGRTQALLIPTPGQTEQIYLAKYHRDLGNFHFAEQKDLDLKEDLKITQSYATEIIHQPELLPKTIELMLSAIN